MQAKIDTLRVKDDNNSEYLLYPKTLTRCVTDEGGNTLANELSDIKARLSTNIDARFLTEEGYGGLRYYNGKFQYYDEFSSTWVDTSVSPENVYIMNMTPNPMKAIRAMYDFNIGHNILRWEESSDSIYDGQAFCIVESVVIRRKLGSAPTDENDGDLVIEIPRKSFGSYKTSYYIDDSFTPNVGEIWYYKAFPMSTTGFYNYSSANEVSVECKDYAIYGFKLDQNESNPASMITYLSDCDNANFETAYMDYTSGTFNYGDWADVWFIKYLKPCMLNYDGTVAYELNKNDYSLKADGTASDINNDTFEGNAMVGIPKVYWKIVDNGDNTANIYFSNKKLDDDYVCWSHIDNNGNEIDYCYMPIYNGSNVDSRLRSLSGKTPMNYQNGTTEITYATANNVTDDIIWYIEVFSDRQLINLLLLLIGKSTDTQTVFGNGRYKDGSSTPSLLTTGTLNTKGLFYGTNGSDAGVKVFGMENWWSNIWRRMAGWIVDRGTQKFKLTYGQSDGTTVDGYNTTGDGYIVLGNHQFSGGAGVTYYINQMVMKPYGLIPVTGKGSSTTYYTDGLAYDGGSNTYALAGGGAHIGLQNGAFYAALDAPISTTHEFFGASISCKPLAKS